MELIIAYGFDKENIFNVCVPEKLMGVLEVLFLIKFLIYVLC